MSTKVDMGGISGHGNTMFSPQMFFPEEVWSRNSQSIRFRRSINFYIADELLGCLRSWVLDRGVIVGIYRACLFIHCELRHIFYHHQILPSS